MTLARCVYCLAAGSAEIRYDKKSRPYVVCRHCGTRSFIRNLEALYGLAVAPNLLDAAIERRDREPAYREWFDGEIAKLVAQARAARGKSVVPDGLPAVPVVPFNEEKKAS